jgi:hypothetical protein
MIPTGDRRSQRREFLRLSTAALGAAALPWLVPRASLAAGETRLRAGEGVVDVTPPLGQVELAGFHRPPDKPRVAISVRQPASARAIVLELGGTRAAIVSLDMLAVATDFTARVQAAIERASGIPAANVRIMATHTHSMPTLHFLRQWGKVSPEYTQKVEADVIKAIQLAADDLAPAELQLGRAKAEGGNYNRTTETWKTENLFDAASSDADRWLDTMLTALVFRRGGGKQDLCWYHFSSHPVCFTDEAAGPDWPGMVANLLIDSHKLAPSFLQGNAGDVNPGIAKGFALAKAEPTSAAVYQALVAAIEAARTVPVDQLRVVAGQFDLPYDMARFADQVETYRKDPAACSKGEWVDPGFSQEWFAAAESADRSITSLRTPLSAMQLGPLGLVFHPSELYSYYGLAIHRGSPFEETLAIGYCDDFVGYLPDPQAFVNGEYAALVVPKMVGVAPYATEAARRLAEQSVALLNQLAGKA